MKRIIRIILVALLVYVLLVFGLFVGWQYRIRGQSVVGTVVNNSWQCPFGYSYERDHCTSGDSGLLQVCSSVCRVWLDTWFGAIGK